MELYNSDTGNLICRVVGDMGKGTDKPYDEEGYIKLNPCLFGEDEGLLEPQIFGILILLRLKEQIILIHTLW